MSEYYWALTLKDKTSIDIPPAMVPVVKRKITNRESINMRTRAVLYAEIESFVKTSKVYTEQALVEAASQAFREPLINEDGSIQAKWVKRSVTASDAARMPHYKRLPDEDGMIVVAYRLPTHQIGVECTPLTESEIAQVQNNT